jgi:hypothetical protein
MVPCFYVKDDFTGNDYGFTGRMYKRSSFPVRVKELPVKNSSFI